MKTYDEHLLADAILATELANRESTLRSEIQKIQAARLALDLPATYKYRRNSRSFRALVKGSTFTEVTPKRRSRAKKKAGRPKTTRPSSNPKRKVPDSRFK